MIATNAESTLPLQVPRKRSWSVAAENVVRHSATLGSHRPSSANDARFCDETNGVASVKSNAQETYPSVEIACLGNGGTPPRLGEMMAEGAASRGIVTNRGETGGPHTPLQSPPNTTGAETLDKTCLCYPYLWRVVGFDPLGIGPEGWFTLKVFYQLGGRNLSEFQTLCSKLQDLYHQLRSYPLTRGIVYVPRDPRTVNIETVWMTVNANLDHLKYYAFHGRYASLAPNLQDKLVPLPHNVFRTDMFLNEQRTAWPRPEKTPSSLPPAAPTLTWGSGTGNLQQPLQTNPVTSHYQQCERYQKVFRNKNAPDIYHRDARPSFPVTTPEQSVQPRSSQPNCKLEDVSLKRRSEGQRGSRTWPSPHAMSDVTRMNVERFPTASPAGQEVKNIVHDGRERYRPLMGEHLLTASGGGGRADGTPVERPSTILADQDCRYPGTLPWTGPNSQKPRLETQTQQKQIKITEGHDVRGIKQEPPEKLSEHALDLTTRTADFQSKLRETIMREVMSAMKGGSPYTQGTESDNAVKKSEVSSLMNMMDRTLPKQFPSEMNDRMSDNRNHKNDFTVAAPEVASPRVKKSFENFPEGTAFPPSRSTAGDLPRSHSKTAQLVDTSHAAQSSSTTDNDPVLSKNCSTNVWRGPQDDTGSNPQLERLQPPPRTVDNVSMDDKEQDEPRKMEVPDMKIITEGHSTLSHMLAGLVGYPLSLVTNIDFDAAADEPDPNTKPKKRISKMGAKILSQFLAGGTDCFEKVNDMIREEFDVSDRDEDVLDMKSMERNLGQKQRNLIRDYRHLSGEDTPKSSPGVMNGTSDILGQLLSGLRSYNTELHKLSSRNPKLDTDRDSEGESTYSCGSDCGGCESCRGQQKDGDDSTSWDTGFGVLPNDSCRQTENQPSDKHIKRERDHNLTRHPLHSYKMPLPARKRHIFMTYGGETLSADSRRHQDKRTDTFGPIPKSADYDSGEGSPHGEMSVRLGNERLGDVDRFTQITVGGCHSEACSTTEETAQPAAPNVRQNVTRDCDLNERDSCPLEMTAKKRKVSLAINSIPNDMLSGRVVSDGEQSLSDLESISHSSSFSDGDEYVPRTGPSRGLPSRMSEWSISDVVRFVTSIPGCENYGDVFKQHAITGSDLPHLTENYMHSVMNLDQGAAMRIRLTMAIS